VREDSNSSNPAAHSVTQSQTDSRHRELRLIPTVPLTDSKCTLDAFHFVAPLPW
jgi:hypothetical protein